MTANGGPNIRKRGKRADGSTRWEVRYRDPYGRLRGKTFRDKNEARRFLNNARADVQRGEWNDPRKADRRFAWYATDWLNVKATQVKPKTHAGYESNLNSYVLPQFGRAKISAISPADVEAFVAKLLADSVSNAVVRNVVIKVLKPIFKRAVLDGALSRNPCDPIKLKMPRSKREMHFLAAEQVKALAQATPPPYDVLVHFLAFMGLRWGEATALRMRHVDLMRGRVQVAEAASDFRGEVTFGPPKTRESERTVALPRFLVQMLTEYLADRDTSPDALLFTAQEGGPLRNANFRQRIFQPAVRRSLPEHLHRLRIHDLRHTCVALLVSQGAHALEIKQRLGHDSVKLTLDTYGHVLPSLDDRLVDGLDALYSAARPAADGTVVPFPRRDST